MGVGAFSAAQATNHLSIEYPFHALVAGAAAALMALAIGFFALRIRGLYLAIATLGFQWAIEASFLQWEPFSGGFNGVGIEKTLKIGSWDFTRRPVDVLPRLVDRDRHHPHDREPARLQGGPGVVRDPFERGRCEDAGRQRDELQAARVRDERFHHRRGRLDPPQLRHDRDAARLLVPAIDRVPRRRGARRHRRHRRRRSRWDRLHVHRLVHLRPGLVRGLLPRQDRYPRGRPSYRYGPPEPGRHDRYPRGVTRETRRASRAERACQGTHDRHRAVWGGGSIGRFRNNHGHALGRARRRRRRALRSRLASGVGRSGRRWWGDPTFGFLRRGAGRADPACGRDADARGSRRHDPLRRRRGERRRVLRGPSRARSAGSSARTAPARPPTSTPSTGSSSRTPGPCGSWGATSPKRRCTSAPSWGWPARSSSCASSRA